MWTGTRNDSLAAPRAWWSDTFNSAPPDWILGQIASRNHNIKFVINLLRNNYAFGSILLKALGLDLFKLET